MGNHNNVELAEAKANGIDYDAAAEARVRRKLDRNMIPLFFVLYKLANWRLLFLVEGLPTIMMAPVAYFFIPDSPDKARFLNSEEKTIARARAVRQAGTIERVGKVDFSELLQTFRDPKAWCMALLYFSANVSYASLPVFLPRILNEMGYSSINAQGLSAPPYFCAFLCALLTTYIADRTR